jgi:hypothetical protein
MAGPLLALRAAASLAKNKKMREKLAKSVGAGLTGLAGLGGYFATRKAPTKAKPALKRSMRFNKQVATTTEKKPTGAMAAYQKRMKAGQRKSNLQRKPRK